MQVGDQLKTINGLDVRDASSWDAMPRAKVGETREFVIDRNGEELTMELTYAAESGKDSMISKVGWFVGLLYLLMVFGLIEVRQIGLHSYLPCLLWRSQPHFWDGHILLILQ